MQGDRETGYVLMKDIRYALMEMSVTDVVIPIPNTTAQTISVQNGSGSFKKVMHEILNFCI